MKNRKAWIILSFSAIIIFSYFTKVKKANEYSGQIRSNTLFILANRITKEVEPETTGEIKEETEITKTIQGIPSEEPEDKDEETLLGPKIDPNFGVIIEEHSEFILYQDVNDKFSFTCQIYSENGKLVKQKK